MQILSMKSIIFFVIISFSVLTFSCNTSSTEENKSVSDSSAVNVNPGAVDASLKLAGGFQATIFKDSMGSARHIAFNGGRLYVKLSGLKDGHGIVILSDDNKDGVADQEKGFGDFGGTGIGISDGYLYASSNDDIYRFKLGQDGMPDTSSKETVIQGLVNKGQHAAKPFTLDNNGNIYINIGAPSNSCQADDRQKGSKGMNPCPILDSAGGIWQFQTGKLNQHYSDGTRYCTGIRNIVALSWNSGVNSLYGVQHGRDDLDRLFPELFTEDQRVQLPAEEMFKINKGDDFGWPYCYYDGLQKKKVQSPEYGGDGKKAGECNGKGQPIYAFPAHWAPNGLMFYTGNQFPEKYKNGAFIAFHGSWNRAPQEQGGYCVAFLPFKDGMPTGDYEIFADGFAGADKTPNGAAHRPCGLAQDPQGNIYVSDDQNGRIWRISYSGS